MFALRAKLTHDVKRRLILTQLQSFRLSIRPLRSGFSSIAAQYAETFDDPGGLVAADGSTCLASAPASCMQSAHHTFIPQAGCAEPDSGAFDGSGMILSAYFCMCILGSARVVKLRVLLGSWLQPR